MSKKIIPQVKTADGTMEDILIDSSAVTRLKTVNSVDLRGEGDIEIQGMTDAKKTAELKYYRYLEDSSATVKPYAIELRNATLNMDEFKKLGSGLFIHWGVYSVPAGTYTGEKVPTATMTTTKLTRNCEWSLRDLGIPLDVYKAYEDQFTGTNFDPEAIVQMAVDCGMKYIVITAKHHEGFSLYPTAYGNWDIRTSACRNTILQELKDACDAKGLKFGVYYSQYWDWEAPGGYGLNHGNKWTTSDPYTAEQHTKFMATVTGQIKELVDKYNPYILWYDPGTNYTDGCVTTLRNAENANWPQVITNNRLDYNRKYGDYGTGERTIYLGTLDYGETCFTLNNTWGYSQNNETESWYYTPEKLFKNFFLYTLSYGQNCLMNIGPKPDGSIPDLTMSRWNSMKSFIQKYAGGSFYGYSKMFTTTRPNWGYMIGLPGNKVDCFVIPNSDDNTADFILSGVDTTMLATNGVNIMTQDTANPATYEILDAHRIRIVGMTLDAETNIGVVQLTYTDTPLQIDSACVVANEKITTGIFPVTSSTYSLYDIAKDKKVTPTTARVYNFAASANKTLTGARMHWCGDTGYYAAKTLATYSANQNGSIITKITLTNEADSSDTQTFTITSTGRNDQTVESAEIMELKKDVVYLVTYNVSGYDTNEMTHTGFCFIPKSSTLTGIELTAEPETLTPKTTVEFTTAPIPAYAGTYTLTWSVDPTSGATLTDNGDGTATLTSNSQMDKTYEVTVTATDTSGTYTATKSIAYSVEHVAEIEVSPETASVPHDTADAVELTATVFPPTADFPQIDWRTSDPTVATVDENGVVSSLSAGTATITAYAAENPMINASCEITVTEDTVIEVENIQLSTNTLDMQECEVVEVTATISPETATYPTLTWQSSDPNVMILVSDGTGHSVKVLAKEGYAGNATITVTPAHAQTTSHPTATIAVTSTLETNDYLFQADSLDGNDGAVLEDTNILLFSDEETDWTLFGWAQGSVNPAAVTNATLYQCVVNSSAWSGIRIDADNNASGRGITTSTPAPLRPRWLCSTDNYWSMQSCSAKISGEHDPVLTEDTVIHPFYFSRSGTKYYVSFDGKNWTETSYNATQINRLKTCPLTVGYDYKRASGAMTTERYRFLKTEGLFDPRVCVAFKREAQYKFAKQRKTYDKDVNNEYNTLLDC